METLHRQVLPFILRRLKEDVLQDLPPKIIQDYYCDLSSLQVLNSRDKRGIQQDTLRHIICTLKKLLLEDTSALT
ncbi:hypothetical protein DPMN_181796 [Dreissena polymorpha]|uniref:Uncharacterized protein n=1 Tax=Dreissena polymorpha TaxID=45954 RepID=A0A9D4I1Z9_DREPO|nr:hypothetical protein DPMN_181796 [Dreissena polymorpha]